MVLWITSAAAQEFITPDNAAQINPLAMMDSADLISSESGGLVAVAEANGTVQVFQNGAEIAVLTGYEGKADFWAVDPSGSVLVTTNRPANQILFWRVNPDQLRQIVMPGKAPVVFSGRLVAYVSDRNTVSVAVLDSILNESASPVLAVLEGHFAPVTDIVFSPDGTLIATASRDGSLSLWNPMTGAQVFILQGHTHPVTSVAFQPEGSLLASGDENGTLRLWNVATGELLAVLENHQTVADVFFSEDGSHLYSVDEQGQAILWGVGEAIALPEKTEISPSANPAVDISAGVRGVSRTTLSAGYSPMHTVGCPIQEREYVLAVARSLDGALLIYTQACEGAVWLYADKGLVDWEIPLDSLPVVTPPQSIPLARLADTTAMCESASGTGDFSAQGLFYPPEYLPSEMQATVESGIGVVVCHEYPTVTIENCHYLGPGNYSYIYTRIRTDEMVRLVDFATQTIIAEERFRGKEPPLCPKAYQRGEVYGSPPDAYIWVEWALETLDYETPIRTRVGDKAITAYTAPDGDVSRELAPHTLLNPIGEQGAWLEVLLPEMTRAWVLKEEIILR